jgi:hypothetical protein
MGTRAYLGIDHDAETAWFTSYWSIKRVRESREQDWQDLWHSWMTVACGEALRLAKVPRNSGISLSMIQDARLITTG